MIEISSRTPRERQIAYKKEMAVVAVVAVGGEGEGG